MLGPPALSLLLLTGRGLSPEPRFPFVREADREGVVTPVLALGGRL